MIYFNTSALLEAESIIISTVEVEASVLESKVLSTTDIVFLDMDSFLTVQENSFGLILDSGASSVQISEDSRHTVRIADLDNLWSSAESQLSVYDSSLFGVGGDFPDAKSSISIQVSLLTIEVSDIESLVVLEESINSDLSTTNSAMLLDESTISSALTIIESKINSGAVGFGSEAEDKLSAMWSAGSKIEVVGMFLHSQPEAFTSDNWWPFDKGSISLSTVGGAQLVPLWESTINDFGVAADEVLAESFLFWIYARPSIIVGDSIYIRLQVSNAASAVSIQTSTFIADNVNIDIIWGPYQVPSVVQPLPVTFGLYISSPSAFDLDFLFFSTFAATIEDSFTKQVPAPVIVTLVTN